jgi:hypothetical protein
VRLAPRAALAGIFLLYAVALVIGATSMPLRLDEILQVSNPYDHSLRGALATSVQTPGAAPLNYLAQHVIVERLGHSRIAARLVSLVFALGALCMFHKVAIRVPLRRPELATLIFAALPLHFLLAITGRPYEQALFFLVLSLYLFLQLRSRPTLLRAVLYSASLCASLYSEPMAFWPSLGLLVFFLPFIKVEQHRRAFWYLLPATAVPPLLYLPYYLWVTRQRSPEWLYSSAPSASIYEQAFENISGAASVAYVLSGLLLLGAVLAVWQSSLLKTKASLRTIVFCLFGSLIVSITAALGFATLSGSPVWPNQMLWICPEIVLLAFILFDFLDSRFARPVVTPFAGILLLALCLIGNAENLRVNLQTDIEALANAIPAELGPDSCVVFVSERLSNRLFLLFQPELKNRECLNFLHPAVVLAIHPYVLPDQQRDATTYFDGLNFVESKRIRIKGGEIIDMIQKDTAKTDTLVIPN